MVCVGPSRWLGCGPRRGEASTAGRLERSGWSCGPRCWLRMAVSPGRHAPGSGSIRGQNGAQDFSQGRGPANGRAISMPDESCRDVQGCVSGTSASGQRQQRGRTGRAIRSKAGQDEPAVGPWRPLRGALAVLTRRVGTSLTQKDSNRYKYSHIDTVQTVSQESGHTACIVPPSSGGSGTGGPHRGQPRCRGAPGRA